MIVARLLLLLAPALCLISSLGTQDGFVDVARSNSPGIVFQKVETNGADVRETLRKVFRTTGFSYSVAPDVQGTVTVDLRDIKLGSVLRYILKQVDSTYIIEGGIYEIIRLNLVDQPPPPMGYTTGIVLHFPGSGRTVEADMRSLNQLGFNCVSERGVYTIKDSQGRPLARAYRGVRVTGGPMEIDRQYASQDNEFYYEIAGPFLKKTSKDNWKLSATCNLVGPKAAFDVTHAIVEVEPGSDLLGKVDFLHADIQEAVKKLFGASGRKYSLDSSVKGRVTLKLSNVKFEVALQHTLQQVKATYRAQPLYAIVNREEPDDSSHDLRLEPVEGASLIPLDQFLQSVHAYRFDEGAYTLVDSSGSVVARCDPVFDDQWRASIMQDDDFLYVVMGATIKVRKSDLQILPD